MQYITPEMVSTRNFQDILTRLANGNLISLFAVDEVKTAYSVFNLFPNRHTASANGGTTLGPSIAILGF